MRKFFTLAALCLAALCANAQDEAGYTIRTLTFEDADFKGNNPTFGGETSWSSLIDEPQYGGPMLYGTGAGFSSEEEAYNKEAEIVTFDFIKRRDNYNTSLGGKSPGTVFKYLYQYDLEGNYIKEWFGVEETSKVFKCYDNRFNVAIKEKRSAFNSFWSFEKVEKLDITNYRLSQHSEIYQYDLEGNLINIWSSVKEIQEQYQFTKNSLCSAKSQKTPLGGFYFVDAFINIIDIIKSRKLIDCITDKSISKYDQNGNRLYILH